MPRRNLAKDLTAIVTLHLAAALLPALIWYLAVQEHSRRERVITTGQVMKATVTRSKIFRFSSRGCYFEYAFELNGQKFFGGDGGCRLVPTHPVGSSVTIRVDPRDAESSVALGSELWPGWAVVPLLIMPPMLLLFAISLYAVLRDAVARQRKRKVTTAS